MGALVTSLALAGYGLAAVVGAATLLWVVSIIRRDASLADPFWAPGFLVILSVYLGLSGPTPRGWLAWTCVLLWSLRLGVHLGLRNAKHGEDRRYAAWRAQHGPRFWWVSLFTVFWLQAVLLWVVSFPLLGVALSTAPLGLWDAAGAAVFLAGFLMEAVADDQLRRFRRNEERSDVLDTGLWRYSRHPNYFGNAVLWWGLFLMAAAAGQWWTAVGPAVMTFLLMRVSGVTLLERDLRTRRPGYEAYIRRTSAFVPWPPRTDDSGG